MSQDIVSDALNQIMNAKRVERNEVVLRKYSKVLLNLFEMMKRAGHLDYIVDTESKTVRVTIIRLNECRAVKPRYYTGVEGIDNYLRRFLPSRKFGELIISTNNGLLNHHEALKENVGGSIIAYFY